MPYETTSKQNTVIWSAGGALIIILLGVIGWFIAGKDTSVLKALERLEASQATYAEKAEKADIKISENINKLCERMGNFESRLSTVEFSIMIPFQQRLELFKGPGNGDKRKNK